jgi:hypothetical protein
VGLRLPFDRAAHEPYAVGFHLLFLLGADLVLLLGSFWVAISTEAPPHAAELRWNLALAGLVGAASLAWLFLRAIGRVRGAGGPGLVLASYGLLARCYVENLVWLGGPALDAVAGLAREHVALARALALVAVAAGLALAAAAELSERLQSSRPKRPDW